jgi:VCBS repeat-containing protein
MASFKFSRLTAVSAAPAVTTVTGTGGDDVITGGTGDQVIDGGAGRDTAVFAGVMASYEITTVGDSVQVRDLDPATNGNDGADTLRNIESLRFLDGAVDLTTATAAALAVVPEVVAADAAEDGAPVTVALFADAGDTRAVVAVDGAGLQGSVSIAPGGKGVIYTVGNAFQGLGAGATATETFSYTIDDGTGAQTTASITVTIVGANDAPAAVNDTVAAVEDQGHFFNILANDSDVDSGDALRLVAIDRTGTKGTTAFGSVGGVQHIYYTPWQSLGAGATATDQFAYTIADNSGAQSTATVTVLVTGVNDAPRAFDDSASVSEDSGATTINVLANDQDVDIGDAKTVLSVDGSGRPASFYLVEGSTFTRVVPVPGIPAIKGTVSVAADGQGIVYNPGSAFDYLRAGQTAVEHILYTMADGSGVQSAAYASVTVVGVNDGPQARADQAGIAKNAAPFVIDVLANDTDADAGDTKAVVAVDTTGTIGGVAIVGGKVVYSVGDAFAGLPFGETATDTFRYTMRDAAGAESSALVTVTIFANIAPVAVADTAAATENGPAVAINVLANDTDGNAGDSKTVLSVNGAGLKGAVSVAAGGGGVVYTIGQAFQGLRAGEKATETFTYTMADSGGAQSAANVTVTVTGVNDAPVAVANILTVSESAGPVTIDVLANDIDADIGDTLKVISLTTTGLKGKAVIAANGSGIVYTPFQTLLAGQTGIDTFSYRMADASGAQSTAKVTITVLGANGAAPVAVNDARTLTEDAPATTIAVLANDTDADVGDTKRVQSINTTGLLGAATIGANGANVVYSVGSAFQYLLTGQSVIERFTYTMVDSGGATSTATVTVTVNGVTDPAKANGDNAVAAEDGGPILINVLSNDYNGDLNPSGTPAVTGVYGGGALSGFYVIGSATGNTQYGFYPGYARLLGQATVAADGSGVYYTPLQSLNQGEVGTDLFLYYIFGSGGGGQASGFVTISVTGANDAPVAFADSSAIAADGAPVFIDVLANDTDPDTRIDPPPPPPPASGDLADLVGDPTPADVPDTKTVVAVNGAGLQGTVTVASGGNGVVYAVGGALLSLGFGQTAVETFTYTMRDALGLLSTASVSVTVTGVNQAPVTQNDEAAVAANGSPVVIDVLANDGDADTGFGDALAIVSVNASGIQGSVRIDGGNLVYDPGNAFQGLGLGVTGTDSFSYTIADLGGAQSTANVTVTVTGVNDAPAAAADRLNVSEDAGPVTIDVLGNDSDPDAGDTATVTALDTTGLLGRAEIAADGSSVIYTVGAAFQHLLNGQTATETFSYSMADSQGVASTATVTVAIFGANEPVVIVTPPPPPPGAIVGTAADNVITGTANADIIYGQAGDDDILAGNGADTVFGGADDDNLEGGAGNDILNGGSGGDDLTGDAGADIFRFYLASESTAAVRDRIRDFSSAQGDKIDLSLIDANTILGGNNDFTLSASFTGAAGQLIHGTTATGYLVQGDVNGDAVADIVFQVDLVGAASLTANDFIY